MEEPSTVSTTKPTQTSDAPKRSEKGLKINYQAAAPAQHEIQAQSHQNEQQPYDFADNPGSKRTMEIWMLSRRMEFLWAPAQRLNGKETPTKSHTKGRSLLWDPQIFSNQKLQLIPPSQSLHKERKSWLKLLKKSGMESRDQISSDRETQILEYH